MKLVVILITICFVLLLYRMFTMNNAREHFLATTNGAMSIDRQNYSDQLLDDIFYYPNEQNGTTGWMRCLSECPGFCVEFGLSGETSCYAY